MELMHAIPPNAGLKSMNTEVQLCFDRFVLYLLGMLGTTQYKKQQKLIQNSGMH